MLISTFLKSSEISVSMCCLELGISTLYNTSQRRPMALSSSCMQLTWGIAAFASKWDIPEPLTAMFISNPANQYQHMWQTNDSKWKTSKVGLSSLELKELGGKEPPLNQCIGAIISSTQLDDATWRANFESLSRSSDHGSSFDHRSWSDRGSSFDVMSWDSRSSIRVHDNLGGLQGDWIVSLGRRQRVIALMTIPGGLQGDFSGLIYCIPNIRAWYWIIFEGAGGCRWGW